VVSTSQTIAAIAVVAAAVLAGAYLSGHLAEEASQRPVISLEEPPASASRAASADPAVTEAEAAPDAN
jgi:hypothetical protein